ncbi:hexamerin 70c [Megachile rotundata]|uniref:hexamerin 70c n=1 Tax=Megachile rotundata TaxID=143995 RepID=UPI000258ECCE
MLKVAFLLALGTLCVAQSAKYTGSRTADMDFLHKQKKVYDLLLYVKQNDLIDAEWYDIGRNYNLESNMDMYKDKNVVQKFLWWYKQGMFLARNAIFTPYNEEQRYEMRMLFDLFYSAKDFQTFYKTACFARLNMQDGMFTTAFTAAVFARNDCKYIRLPAIYEIYPNLFFDSTVIEEAQNIKMSRGSSSTTNVGNIETYMIAANYSSRYLPMFEDREYKMDYFMEDVSLNAYYYYFRSMFPFWMNSNKYNIPKEVRGELYYFIHKQLLARYNLERLSNDLGKVEDFDWFKPIFPGYYSTLMYRNGIAIPQRNRYSSVPYYKYKYLKDITALEMRIMDAIDSGYLVDEQGKNIDIYTPEGLYMLANVIEGNVDSCNRRFYGMYDALARDILGFSFEQPNKNKVIPSALQCDCTSMRDPAFYMLYRRIMSFFFRYKKNLPQYSQSDLQMPGVKFESVNVDKLYTFFDNCDTLINNAVAADNFKNGMSLRIKTRRPCLNYQPFTYKFNINSDREMKAVLTIFLGPAFKDVKEDMVYLQQFYNYFVEMDKFVVTLRPGSNSIERHSSESPFTTSDMMPGDAFYDKLTRAISGGEPFMYSEKFFDFSERLTLPRGKRAGMMYKMFFFLSPLEEGSMKTYEFPMFGKFMFQDKPLGFPLDRPMWAWNFTIPNMYFKDVYIYNRQNEKGMMNY